MKRPSEKDYDFNVLFEAVLFSSEMIKYVNYLESPKNKILKFKDLIFKPHPLRGYQAEVSLSDGTEISVVYGCSSFYSGNGTYEMKSDRINTNYGVRGYLTPNQITAHMVYCQKNPKAKTKTL